MSTTTIDHSDILFNLKEAEQQLKATEYFKFNRTSHLEFRGEDTFPESSGIGCYSFSCEEDRAPEHQKILESLSAAIREIESGKYDTQIILGIQTNYEGWYSIASTNPK